MGQAVGLMSALCSAKKYDNLNLRAVEYLAALPSEEYSNVFALRINPDTEGVYYHEFESDDYAGTVRSYEEGKPGDTRCMYYVPWADSNYCIFYDLGDATHTVCVIDLANTSRVVDICGANARKVPVETIIDTAQYLFENDSGSEESEGEVPEGEVPEGEVPTNTGIPFDNTQAMPSNGNIADENTDPDGCS
jgi:hypothetical protein